MEADGHTIWKAFCAALGAEYREHKEIQGTSGLIHPVQAIAVDEKRNRLIVVSAEYNPRIAALMRVDIQATLPSTRVLVARPIAIDLAHASRLLFTNDKGELNYNKVLEIATVLTSGEKKVSQKLLTERYGPQLSSIFEGVKRSGLPVRSHILHTIEQAASVDWGQLKGELHSEAFGLMISAVQMFQRLDNLAEDRRQGICPVPTYELTENDWELFLSGSAKDEIEQRLRALNIYQYFYPPADSVALAMVDNAIGTVEGISAALDIAASSGHEISENELLPEVADIPEMLEAFKSAGYIAEGEMSCEITPAGKSVRQSVKFRPRESLISKVIGQFSAKVNLDLKDFLK
ncbi:hypothetical protein G6L29_10635 [Agrobacterium rhizogenes]|uniref:hypothetical protein n=1 Tax=Rhizobium rhizogenes TaxID=359 RepID=UPI001573AB33|nr:hypothetical protein [Rhizobium rhizogenes]NTI16091.1 hypothetical protein [Rhizobium rhizogenes]